MLIWLTVTTNPNKKSLDEPHSKTYPQYPNTQESTAYFQ